MSQICNLMQQIYVVEKEEVGQLVWRVEYDLVLLQEDLALDY